MKFSELYSITLAREGDWFDPVLSMDTKLFIDPFLIYANEVGPFEGSHVDIIDFFNDVFKLVAKSKGDRFTVPWKKAEALLRLPEVEELCLGYTRSGTSGSGSGPGLATVMTEALWEAVQAGLTEITHFEEVGILREGLGADRISDATASIVRSKLVPYTQSICVRHKIPVKRMRFLYGYYNKDYQMWMPLEGDLPQNPHNGKSILLVPRVYVRDLPTINADDFWDYSYNIENETLRNDFSYDITKNVDKKTIIDFARRHPDVRKRYIDSVEQTGPEPYDLTKDKRGLVKWYGATQKYCREYPLSLKVKSQDDFSSVVERIIKEFSNYVENNQGWRLLWNDNGTPRREEVAQTLFLGIVKHYCKANDIDISREANIGRGPVDFKVSIGYSLRALLELKLAKNTRFWNGLDKQLPKYQEAEGVELGYFVVILFDVKDYEKVTSINDRVNKVNNATGYSISAVLVDATWSPPSASKL